MFANVAMAALLTHPSGFYFDYSDSISVSVLTVSHELMKMSSQAGMSLYARRITH